MKGPPKEPSLRDRKWRAILINACVPVAVAAADANGVGDLRTRRGDVYRIPTKQTAPAARAAVASGASSDLSCDGGVVRGYRSRP